ncbi:MAG: alpha/beta hydrolase [Candidatus Velthaea sp.]
MPSGGMLHESGAPEGPAVLFLHGVGGAAWSWQPQVAALAGEYRAFVWEARGHGAAPPVDDAGLGDYFVDAREALDAVRARGGSVTIAGHSMGGLLAIALAAESPLGVRALVLVDPVYPASDGAPAHDLGPFKPLLLQLLRPLVRSVVRDGWVARALSRWIFVNSFTDKRVMETAWCEQRRQVPVEYPKMFFEAFGSPAGFPELPFAAAIDIPVLLFNARSKELEATLAARLGPRLENVRIAGGHYLQWDRAAQVNERLRRFLGEAATT